MFRIILPQTDEVASEPGPIRDASSRGRETILLVEDEDLVRVLAKRVLERAGFAVLTAENADQALALAADHDGRIDLLLTDVIMPRILGPELAIRLELLRPGLRVLFTSGYTAGGSGLTASIHPMPTSSTSRSARAIWSRRFGPRSTTRACRSQADPAPGPETFPALRPFATSPNIRGETLWRDPMATCGPFGAAKR